MTGSGARTHPGRGAAVLAISAGLVIVGTLLLLGSGPSPVQAPFTFPALLLLPLYLAALRRPLDFEFRKDSVSITLTQLPLALGVLLVAPGTHLLLRLVALLLDSVVLRRLSPLKVAFNTGGAVLEVGLVTAAVSTIGRMDEPGPALWLALYVGLLVSDVLANLALQASLALMGRHPSRSELLQQLSILTVTSTVFTAMAIVALSAAWTDPSSILVTLALAAGLALAYRGHRRQSAREHSTERLYEFVKELGPVTLDQPDAPAILQKVRELLHSRHLDLTLCESATGARRHLTVSDGDAPSPAAPVLDAVAVQALVAGTPALAGRGRGGDSQRMTTPLVGSDGLIGVLTAEDRLGTVRGFDLGDLRLLETIGAELATALERGRLLADLERAATTDPLTDLPNLSRTTWLLAHLIDTSRDGVVLAAVAVDSFRVVNDMLGHQVGDELLVEVAVRLRRAMPHAIVGRIGGGRFAIAVPAALAGGEPGMFGLGLRAQVEGSAQLSAVGTHVRLSVGCACSPEHGDDAATLIRRAETAMYSARHADGGPVLWEPAYEIQGQRKLAVVTALRDALAAGAVGVAFQPKVRMADGTVSGIEALARWTHPALGEIEPDEFVPLAEASGLMGPLTAGVLRQSLIACRSWQSPGRRVGVAVNVSADTVLDPAFVTEVAARLAEGALPADLLTLELTESVVMKDADLAVLRMRELRALGVRLSVDDFGTGYSSLTYLKGLPVDEVKIDKGFVDELVVEPANRAVVRAVVDIAHTLGLRVVAEGVEDDEQQQLLRALGVDEAQGFLHARPMPAGEVLTWLTQQPPPAEQPAGGIADTELQPPSRST